ncbi:MAG: hypothetical protein MHM6MM_001773 [Cercozoa sp. M6MM]
MLATFLQNALRPERSDGAEGAIGAMMQWYKATATPESTSDLRRISKSRVSFRRTFPDENEEEAAPEKVSRVAARLKALPEILYAPSLRTVGDSNGAAILAAASLIHVKKEGANLSRCAVTVDNEIEHPLVHVASTDMQAQLLSVFTFGEDVAVEVAEQVAVAVPGKAPLELLRQLSFVVAELARLTAVAAAEQSPLVAEQLEQQEDETTEEEDSAENPKAFSEEQLRTRVDLMYRALLSRTAMMFDAPDLDKASLTELLEKFRTKIEGASVPQVKAAMQDIAQRIKVW